VKLELKLAGRRSAVGNHQPDYVSFRYHSTSLPPPQSGIYHLISAPESNCGGSAQFSAHGSSIEGMDFLDKAMAVVLSPPTPFGNSSQWWVLALTLGEPSQFSTPTPSVPVFDMHVYVAQEVHLFNTLATSLSYSSSTVPLIHNLHTSLLLPTVPNHG
jgi:hypothetical protein